VAAGLVNDGSTRSDKIPLLTWKNIQEYNRVLVGIIIG
jgi:predicted subunit of tRNA(5-methylaminomethyl-2-thiouridylate) methyltransferase